LGEIFPECHSVFVLFSFLAISVHSPQQSNKNITYAIKSWLAPTGWTTDNECYKQVATVAFWW